MKKHIFSLFFITIASVFFIIYNAQALCVKVPVANLRAGPGTEYKKTWEVYKYMPFKKITQTDKWIKVQDVDGDTHWISEILITTEFQCAVVTGKKINVRKDPSTAAEKSILSPAEKYFTYKCLEKKGKWVKIEDFEGDVGWIHSKFVWIQ
jgi:SH3-like domain-containing protein